MNRIITELEQKLKFKDYTLPVLPDIAMKVVNISSNDNVDFSELSKIIQQDSTIASQILRISNSPIYSLSSTSIISVQQAIARLGTKNIAEIALTITLQNGIFNSSIMRHYSQLLWKHALSTALWCKVIAFSKKQSVEALYITGLLHEIGKPIILKIVIDISKKIGVVPTEDEFREIVTNYSRKITVELLEEWQLPRIITTIVKQYKIEEYTDYVFETNVLKLANELSHLLLEDKLDSEEVKSLPEWTKLNLYADEVREILSKAESIKETLSNLVV